MNILNHYFELQEEIYKYFGYVEDYRVIPLSDETLYFWWLNQSEDGTGVIWYADARFSVELITAGENLYSAQIYTQRFLDKWVYRGAEYTMICADTRTDGNKFLMVFDNEKELKAPSPEMLAAFAEWGEL